MESFLETVVEHLHAEYGDKISQLCIVLPNRRAGLFLKKQITDRYQTAIWAPDIFSIEEFVETLSSSKILEPLTLLFEFYQHYKQQEKSQAQGFDEFMKWGQTLLSDFNEADLNLVPAQQLFGFVSEARAMEEWNADGATITDTQKKYIEFWESIGHYYDSFTTHLREHNQAYSGLVFRQVAEALQVGEDNEILQAVNQWDRIIFAGFNALSKSEEVIIQQLELAGDAEVLWDSDRYYMEDKMQEAGKFLRDYKSNSQKKPFLWEFDQLTTGKKHIELVGVSSNIAQAKVAGTIIPALSGSPDCSDTAVVLADENLLIPVLQSLPDKVKHINVTMGYPLKNTPLHGLFQSIFVLHENAHRLAANKESPQFHHKDILAVLQHPFIKNIPGSHELTNHFAQSIRTHNTIFMRSEDLAKMAGTELMEVYKPLAPIFSNWQQKPQEALVCFRSLIENFRDHLLQASNNYRSKQNVEIEYLYLYTKAIKRLQVLLEQYGTVSDLSTLKAIFHQVVGGQHVPFYGEPLQGLQVMGMLETRLLDFKNIIVLSVNEGILPEGKTTGSFISNDIRKEFDLPTHYDRDAIYAYHFYRLLQRAERVILLYNTEGDDFGGGEKSRFVTQLEHELKQRNSNVTFTKEIIDIPVMVDELEAPSVKKDEWILQGLLALMERGVSPSALNKYVNCPLDFYYRYIIGLGEEDEVEETIQATTLGSLIHEVLENFYTPCLGKKLTSKDIDQMLPQVASKTRGAFLEQFTEAEIDGGKNLLTLKVAIKFVEGTLENEKAFLEELATENRELTIIALEKELTRTITVGSHEVKLVGKADRIDKIGRVTRIVDYKTGVTQAADVKLDALDELLDDSSKAKALQLLMYALLYHSELDNPGDSIQSGIISMRKLSEGFQSVRIGTLDILTESLLLEFEQKLQIIIAEMLDLDTPFVHQELSTYCDFCQP